MSFYAGLVNICTIARWSRLRADLTAYVPRIVVEWALSEPDALHRRLDGTMAFVDISGFTAMSEKLATQGKAGAEQVTEVMNATFDALLRRRVRLRRRPAQVRRRRTARLLRRRGPRAARGARGVRDAQDAALDRTPEDDRRDRDAEDARRPQLRPLPFFARRAEHRELIVSGPAATTTVEMEAASEAGEILLSRSHRGAPSPQRCSAKSEAGGFLLAAAPDAERGLKPLPPVDGLDLGECVPQLVREHCEPRQAEPEHRMAAVAFLRLRGTDALVLRDGPEAAAAAVAEVVEAVQAAAAEHDVCFLESDIDQDGGADRARRRSAARLGARRRAAPAHGARRRGRGDAAARSSIGVSRGRVFAGEVGAPFRRTYTILGGTAALAARLMAKAGRWTDPRARADCSRSRQTTFEVEHVAPLQVKGNAEPVEAVALGAIAERAAGTPTGRRALPLIGRQREIAVLTAALGPRAARLRHDGRAVGEAGIGKSRLLQELRAKPTISRRSAPAATSTSARLRTSPSASLLGRSSIGDARAADSGREHARPFARRWSRSHRSSCRGSRSWRSRSTSPC